MNEDIIIKRNWVKKAGVIFLIIMLLLTFFSKTIMNSSLPEVSVQNIKAGQMNLTVSGSGTAQAVSTYEVMLNETRTVTDVLVQPGDSVTEGDVLFTLDKTESEELISALDTLDDLNLQYQKMLLGQADGSYTAEDRNIAKVKIELEKAMQSQEDHHVSNKELTDAETNYNSIKNEIADLENNISNLQEELTSYAGATDDALLSLERQIEDKKRQIRYAQNNDTPNPISLDTLQTELSRLKEDLAIEQSQESPDESLIRDLNRRIEDKKKEITNYSPYLEGPSIDIGQLRIELERLEDDYDTGYAKNKKYELLNNNIFSKKDALRTKKADFESAQSKYDELKTKREQWKAANEEVQQLQQSLEDLMFALEEKKIEDKKNTAISNLDLDALRKDIAKKNDMITKLRAESQNGKIVAQKSGIVQSIGIAAGGITSPGNTMAVIETTEKGYAISFTVTKEQSNRLSIGDEAKTDNPKVKATLSQIKTNPSGLKDERVLTFLLSGDVKSGEDYAINIKKPGKKYEAIIPQSALRSDSSGYFVLTVSTKKTPFGVRYVAQRINVDVIDRDDENIAISGSLNEGDYVITFASKPLESTMQIRMQNGQ